MAKWLNDLILDAGLDDIALGTIMTVCSAQPTSRTEATSTYTLADVAMSAGDFTKADDTSGRKLTIAAKNSVLIDTTGDPTHIAICDATNLLAVTTCTGGTLTANGLNTVNIPSWVIHNPDPV